jgi:hypothetical protein
MGIGVLVVALIALAGVAAFKELATPKPQQRMVADSGYANSQRPAISPEEEAYAHSLWPIHAQVKQDAVKMTFAGLAYKMGDIKRAAIRERIAPLTPRFEQALAEMAKIKPPPAVKPLHDDYAEAIRLYREASMEMVRIAADGDERHLLQAQEKTEEASGLTLKVGETLWPGEFKPN